MRQLEREERACRLEKGGLSCGVAVSSADDYAVSKVRREPEGRRLGQPLFALFQSPVRLGRFDLRRATKEKEKKW